MAERRMIAKTVLHSPAFLAMPAAAQMLYVHLELFADDDGFVATPVQVVRMMGIQKRYYQILIDKDFVIPFDSGVCVLRHWLLNNQIRTDRYTPTIYQTEKEGLRLDKTKVYCFGIPNDNQMATQYREDKTRPEKKREEKTSGDKPPLSQRMFVL